MVLQTSTTTSQEIGDQMSPQVSGGFVKVPRAFHKSSLGFRGHLITNLTRRVLFCLISFCFFSA